MLKSSLLIATNADGLILDELKAVLLARQRSDFDASRQIPENALAQAGT